MLTAHVMILFLDSSDFQLLGKILCLVNNYVIDLDEFPGSSAYGVKVYDVSMLHLFVRDTQCFKLDCGNCDCHKHIFLTALDFWILGKSYF